MDTVNLSSKDWTATGLAGVYDPEVETQRIREVSPAGAHFDRPFHRISRWDISDQSPRALGISCTAIAYLMAVLLAARISFGSARLLFEPVDLSFQRGFFSVLGLSWAALLILIGGTSWGTSNKRALSGYFRSEVVFLLALCEAYVLGAKLTVCEAFLAASLMFLPLAFILRNVSLHIARSGYLIRHDANILIIGAKSRACETISALQRTAEKYNIIGCLEPDASLVGSVVAGVRVIGTLEELPDCLFGQPLDLVLFALPLQLVPDAKTLITLAVEAGIPVSVVLDGGLQRLGFAEDAAISGKKSRKVETVVLSNVPYNRPYLIIKRVCDIVVSTSLLVLLSPLFVLLAILVKLSSPDGPVFYPWRVLGHNRRAFTGYKFRTMVPNADRLKEQLLQHNEMTGPVFKMRNDPRITPIGKVLRTYSLDELPQLYSVFKGDMSLVGPRPPSKKEADQFVFWQRRKLSIKPGITCLWQVSGRNEIRSFDEWVRLDLRYIRQASLWSDLRILLKTVPAVIGRRGAH